MYLPQDARVDPGLFPEDEFPVYCPWCNYLLRGLPDDRCPECGKHFDPGRLLVVQYVEDKGRRQWPQINKWPKRFLLLSGVLLLGWLYGMEYLISCTQSGTKPWAMSLLRWLMSGTWHRALTSSPLALMTTLAVLSFGLYIRGSLHRRKKRLQISAYFYKDDSPRDRRMRRHVELVLLSLVVVIVAPIAMLVGGFILLDNQTRAKPPIQAMIVGIVVGIAILVVGPFRPSRTR
ncbi:MAG: hypothetical protein KA354_01280 [Phycisphaerae bacterium]|nr:hypothetical protein [Phycisphaerae bacterium]